MQSVYSIFTLKKRIILTKNQIVKLSKLSESELIKIADIISLKRKNRVTDIELESFLKNEIDLRNCQKINLSDFKKEVADKLNSSRGSNHFVEYGIYKSNYEDHILDIGNNKILNLDLSNIDNIFLYDSMIIGCVGKKSEKFIVDEIILPGCDIHLQKINFLFGNENKIKELFLEKNQKIFENYEILLMSNEKKIMLKTINQNKNIEFNKSLNNSFIINYKNIKILVIKQNLENFKKKGQFFTKNENLKENDFYEIFYKSIISQFENVNIFLSLQDEIVSNAFMIENKLIVNLNQYDVFDLEQFSIL